MPELDTITVRGFKSIAALESLALRDINVLIGPNGSGKSNFIGVFSFLNAVREGQLQDYVIKAGGADRVLHFGASVTESLSIDISFQQKANRYKIDLAPSSNDELIPISETIYFWNKQRYPDEGLSRRISRVGKEAGISSDQQKGIGSHIRHHLDSWRLYHFHDTSSTSNIKRTADIDDNRFLRPNGSNLAPFLFYLKQREPTAYDLIRRTIQVVAPFFADFQLEPQQLNAEKIRLEWRHRRSDAYFDASSLSDGTLRFIGLTTLLLQPKKYRPSVILIDEPEIGLHPSAITLLASLIKQAATETQVIVSTQSSLLLDHFAPEDVLVADLVNNATEFTRLDSSKLQSWLREYSLGQLWEKNELGGRPRD